jgi:hypothetical protein
MNTCGIGPNPAKIRSLDGVVLMKSTKHRIVVLSLANMMHRRMTDETSIRARTSAEILAIRELGTLDYWQPGRKARHKAAGRGVKIKTNTKVFINDRE